MALTIEHLDQKIAKVNESLARYRADAESANWEIAHGSKVFIKHHEAELEILELARLGLLK